MYTLDKKLGEGSFGTVYAAKRISTQSMHAIKSIKKSSLLSNPMLPALMMSELTILHDLSHPGIMQVNELLEDDENYFIVTEILEGGELFDRIIEV